MKVFKKLAAFLLLIPVLVSFVTAQVNLEKTTTTVPDNAAAIQSVAHNLVSALVAGDFDKASTLLHPDFTIWGLEENKVNKTDYLEVWKNYHSSATQIGITKGGIVALHFPEGDQAGDWAAWWGQTTWTPNELEKPVYAWTHMMCKVVDNQIHTVYQFQDNLATLMQMGYEVAPPGTFSSEK